MCDVNKLIYFITSDLLDNKVFTMYIVTWTFHIVNYVVSLIFVHFETIKTEMKNKLFQWNLKLLKQITQHFHENMC